MPNTDQTWQRWATEDAYYGVMSDDKYRRDNLSMDLKREFLESGDIWISHVLATIATQLRPGFKPSSALDFGCGVGRLVIPLAKICNHVTGVDIADAMLAEARANADAAQLGNVTLVKSDDELSKVIATFDLIHSAHVFQHMPVARGERVTERLLESLSPDGVAVLHFNYYRNASRLRKTINWFRQHVPLFHGAVQLAQGQEFSEPPMQMNSYDLNTIMRIMQSSGVTKVFIEYQRYLTYLSAVFYCTKDPTAPSGLTASH